jgi:hypothetical protein
MLPRISLVFLAFGLLLLQNSLAQKTANLDPASVDNNFVQKQFGSSCTVHTAVPAVSGDLNGDGIEDIVIAARCKDPMMDAAENHYTVLDPYFAFYGFGDPKITTQFSTADPENRGLALLIIHGAGAEAWRAAEPKAKFLIVNLAYKQVNAKPLIVKKKQVLAIYVIESGEDQMTSAMFFDGKKYKYQPMGSSME